LLEILTYHQNTLNPESLDV